MTQTFNGPDTPGIRIAAVTIKGFKIRMSELVSSVKGGEHQALSTGIRASGTIGWGRLYNITAGQRAGFQRPPNEKPRGCRHALLEATLWGVVGL
jgi:hypothetical protein